MRLWRGKVETNICKVCISRGNCFWETINHKAKEKSEFYQQCKARYEKEHSNTKEV